MQPLKFQVGDNDTETCEMKFAVSHENLSYVRLF